MIDEIPFEQASPFFVRANALNTRFSLLKFLKINELFILGRQRLFTEKMKRNLELKANQKTKKATIR